MLASFKDKVVLITGGTGSLGRGLGDLLAAEGALVVVTARREPQSLPPNYSFIQSDAEVPGESKRVLDLVVARFGRLDMVVPLPGGGHVSIPGEITEGLYDSTFTRNVKHAVMLANESAPHLVSSKGVLLFVGSVAASECHGWRFVSPILRPPMHL